MRKIQGRNGGTLSVAEKGEVLNPKGRPPRLITTIVAELQEQGIQPVKPQDIVSAFESMMNTSQERLREISKDEKAPYFIRRIAGEMLSGRGYDVFERMLDRAHGKAKIQADITSAGEKIDFGLPNVIIE